MSNAPEYSVSELAGAVKRAIEENFGRVRVRGELGRVTVARSGHCYLDLKDDKAVINSIIWKGTMSRLRVAPEEGMEVIVEGRMSTYPGRSNYQLIIESLELAGAGALMALLEKRRAQLAKEGLFDKERKKELPFLPRVIGVVTSPTGAVIRDILHRVEDRFPVHVILWPTTVQGEGAAERIATAIAGFNAMGENGPIPRPDVLIVGRGGGSVEDLWAFNEEVVVRATAASDIPVISAVGHETDTTLIDYASDRRAPTPTGAAEIAVPVRTDLMFALDESEQRLARALRRRTMDAGNRLRAARLPQPGRLLETATLRLDRASLPSVARLLERPGRQLATARLPSLRNYLSRKGADLAQHRLPDPTRALGRATERLDVFGHNLSRAGTSKLSAAQKRFERASILLDAYSYQGVLQRGFALVTTTDGQVVRSREGVSVGDAVTLEFADGKRGAVIEGEGSVKPAPTPKHRRKKADARPTKQGDLF